MKRFAYHIPREFTPHGHAINGVTKAPSEARLRAILAVIYGEEAAAAAEVWTSSDEVSDLLREQAQ